MVEHAPGTWTMTGMCLASCYFSITLPPRTQALSDDPCCLPPGAWARSGSGLKAAASQRRARQWVSSPQAGSIWWAVSAEGPGTWCGGTYPSRKDALHPCGQPVPVGWGTGQGRGEAWLVVPPLPGAWRGDLGLSGTRAQSCRVRLSCWCGSPTSPHTQGNMT